jgi:hypothetical protein
MTNKTDADIPCKTLERTPFDCHIVHYIARIGEKGFIARETTALEFLRRIIVDTECADPVPAGTWIGRCLTLVDIVCTVSTVESVGASLITSKVKVWIVLLVSGTGSHLSVSNNNGGGE